MEHTVGNWTVRPIDLSYKKEFEVSCGDTVIACTDKEGDAHLIAAAPTLWYALSQIMKDLPKNRDWLDPTLEKLALLALSQAKGGITQWP